MVSNGTPSSRLTGGLDRCLRSYELTASGGIDATSTQPAF
jgi:hypothetical protein